MPNLETYLDPSDAVDQYRAMVKAACPAVYHRIIRRATALSRLGVWGEPDRPSSPRVPPTCFMHIQKCAGQSLYAALDAALPPGSLAPRRMEPANFCSFDDFDLLGDDARARVAVGDDELLELRGYRAVFGHFTLPTLARLAPLSGIGTVLREPRARLLSYYVYLRCKVALRTMWAPYDVHVPAEQSLAGFLAEPRVARTTDNRVCRMVMHGDPRVRDGEFIHAADLEPLAEAAVERLERLGFVGLLEDRDAAWRGMGRLFGVALAPARENVTGEEEVWPGALPVPPFGGAETLDLLERRTRADAMVYRRMAARSHGDDGARSLAAAAFAGARARYESFTRPAGDRLDSLAAGG